MSWKYPESWEDPTSTWNNEQYALDNNEMTYAQAWCPENGFTQYLYFFPRSDKGYVLCDKVRLYSENDFEGEYALQAYTDHWFSIDSGDYDRECLYERDIPGGPLMIKEFRIAFTNDSDEDEPARLNEFQFSEVVTNVSHSLVNGSLADGGLTGKGLAQ
jgi:hypothetical protein